MKSANVISVTGPDHATVSITSDDGTSYTVENLGPLPLTDATALWKFLEGYDAAFVACKALVAAPSGAVTGALSAPVEG